jgi:chemotaxis protein methyltransferase CheR
VTHLLTYFQPLLGDTFRVKDELRNLVAFHERNLLEPFTGLPLFDVVFCRNVLIYFDVQAKAGVLDRLATQLTPDGVVILGGSETTLGITNTLERVGGAGVYARRGSVPNAA